MIEPTIGAAMGRVENTESTPPLWYGLAWLVEQAGLPVEAARGIGVVASALLAGLLVVYARRMLPLWAAGLAGLIVALAGQLVLRGAELRAYALYALLALAFAWLLERAAEKPSWGRLAALAGVAAAGLLTHYFFVFVALAAVAWLWTTPTFRASRLPVSVSLAAAVLPFLLWLPSLVQQVENQRFSWIGDFSLLKAVAVYSAFGWNAGPLYVRDLVQIRRARWGPPRRGLPGGRRGLRGRVAARPARAADRDPRARARRDGRAPLARRREPLHGAQRARLRAVRGRGDRRARRRPTAALGAPCRRRVRAGRRRRPGPRDRARAAALRRDRGRARRAGLGGGGGRVRVDQRRRPRALLSRLRLRDPGPGELVPPRPSTPRAGRRRGMRARVCRRAGLAGPARPGRRDRRRPGLLRRLLAGAGGVPLQSSSASARRAAGAGTCRSSLPGRRRTAWRA